MKKHFKITHILLLSSAVFGGYAWFKHFSNSALSYHCDKINEDITRPPERMCIKPLLIKGNDFTFKTENNNVEVYTIVPLSGSVYRIGDGEEFQYIFLNYQRGSS